MESYKVLVKNESESKEVQCLFFELGGDFYFGGKLYCNTHLGLVTINKDGLMANLELDSFDYEEITIDQLRDMVVLKRNSVDDATHTGRSGSQYYIGVESYFWDGIKWEQRDFLNLGYLKPIEKECEVKMKEYLDTNYELRSVKQTSGDNHAPTGWIEVPEGAEIFLLDKSFCEDTFYFVKHDGEVFHEYYTNATDVSNNAWIKGTIKEFHKDMGKVLWKRKHTKTIDSKDTTIQDKLKFIEKWLNGEKIQYILGIETEKTQWHNFTEGAMQYIKRPDIKFREAPKYVTINGVEFKSVEKLLKYVKNNFTMPP